MKPQNDFLFVYPLDKGSSLDGFEFTKGIGTLTVAKITGIQDGLPYKEGDLVLYFNNAELGHYKENKIIKLDSVIAYEAK
jgi:hypothetical protein